MNKKIGIELALASIAAVSTIGAVSLLDKENTLVSKTSADDPIVLVISNASLGGYYTGGGNFYTQFAPAPLSNPDSYFSLYNDFDYFDLNTSGSILFEGRYRHGYSNNFGLVTDSKLDPIYMSREDVTNNKPINISMFSRLESVEFFMSSESELKIDLSKFANTRVNTQYIENTNSYLISKRNSEWINKATTTLRVSPLATAEDNNKTFIIEKIVITYYCG